jgi:hypothetical protein
MTTKEKVQSSLTKINKILSEDFITVPVKESLTVIKTELTSAISEL